MYIHPYIYTPSTTIYKLLVLLNKLLVLLYTLKIFPHTLIELFYYFTFTKIHNMIIFKDQKSSDSIGSPHILIKELGGR